MSGNVFKKFLVLYTLYLSFLPAPIEAATLKELPVIELPKENLAVKCHSLKNEIPITKDLQGAVNKLVKLPHVIDKPTIKWKDYPLKVAKKSCLSPLLALLPSVLRLKVKFRSVHSLKTPTGKHTPEPSFTIAALFLLTLLLNRKLNVNQSLR